MAWSFNDKRNKNRRNVSTQKSFEYEKLLRFLRNRYGYEYIDEDQKKKFRRSIPFQYLEKLVAETGRAAVYEHPEFGIAVYKAVMAGNLNIYGQPNTYFLYTANGTQIMQVQADDPKLVILQDNFNGSPFARIAERYGEMLGRVRETTNTNIQAMRTPYLVQAPKEKLLEVRMAMEAMNEAPEVIVDPNLEFSETVKVVDLKTPDNLKSLEDEYNTIMGKFMEEVGFATNTIDKKERLVAGEAEDDDEILKAFDGEPYRYRLTFIELMDEQFGIKLKLVKANDNLYTNTKAPVKEKENV